MRDSKGGRGKRAGGVSKESAEQERVRGRGVGRERRDEEGERKERDWRKVCERERHRERVKEEKRDRGDEMGKGRRT